MCVCVLVKGRSLWGSVPVLCVCVCGWEGVRNLQRRAQKSISSSVWRCPSDSCSLLFPPLHLFSFSSLFLCRSRCLAPSPLCPLCRQKAGITAPPGKMLCIILCSPFLAAFTATNVMCILSIKQAGGKKENSQEKKCRLFFFLLLLLLVWLCVWSLISISLGIISLLFGTDWEYLLLTYSKDGVNKVMLW